MRSTLVGQGRHRIGLPGLVPVRQFVTVAQRSLLARLFGFGRRAGRHHLVATDAPAERIAPALQTAAA
ncbi:MAG: hypothetical protein M3Z00_08255 [Actinomycetota bacterium]|nr:hypothetical protein [Actinomycetota bacterium]